MEFKPGRASQKRYTHDEYLEYFFPSARQPELPGAGTPFELGVRLGKRAMELFVEGLRKSKGISGD